MKPGGPKRERQNVQILLVEDDPDDVWIMRNLLSDRWDGPFKLTHVELLSAGLERVAEVRFDIILLDLSLPDSQGLETFFTMHAHAQDVPIVVLSGYNDESTAVRAVQAGAQDYLVKGSVDDNLLVRSIRYAIERTRRHIAEAALRDASEEFRAAREIQQRLFPAAAPALPGFDIAGALYPAKATAGDYFDYIPMLGNCVGVVVGDVSSHGMGPALLMSETRACLRTLALGHSDVGDILTLANRMLSADTDDFHFVTLALARIDPASCEMVYGSAGQRSYLLAQRPQRDRVGQYEPAVGCRCRDPRARRSAAGAAARRRAIDDDRRGGGGRIGRSRSGSAWAGLWKSSPPAASSPRRKSSPRCGAKSTNSAGINRYKMT